MATAVGILSVLLLPRLFHKLLIRFIPRMLTRPSLSEKKLAADIKQQRQQILLINVQDEFAKYAKLQRQIKKREDELSKRATEHQIQGLKIKGILWCISLVLYACCHFWLVWTYMSVPVAILPNQWLYPLDTIVRFPTAIEGAIGLPSWLLICNSVIFMIQT